MLYNATTDSDSVVCVFPISGQYGTLNRVLFYILLCMVTIFHFRKRIWLTIGAWAYIMTYAASTAVHAIVMTAARKRGFYNLDIVGAWIILSSSLFAGGSTALSSSRLRDSRYRPIFAAWGTFVGIGAFCCMATFIADYPLEPACRSSISSAIDNNTSPLLLTDQSQLTQFAGQFNCTYSCFDRTYPTRDASEITIITAERAFNFLYSRLLELATATASIGGLCLLYFVASGGIRRGTRAELQAKANQTVNYSMDIDFISAKENEIYEAKKELETGKYQEGPHIITLASLILSPISLGFNEAYIAGRGTAIPALPQSEPAYAVGQWAPWVSVGLTLIAAEINARYEPRWKELRQEWDEHDRIVRKNEAMKRKDAKTASTNAVSDQSPDSCKENVTATEAVVAPTVSEGLQEPKKARLSLVETTAVVSRERADERAAAAV